MVSWTHLNVALYAHCLYCLMWPRKLFFLSGIALKRFRVPFLKETMVHYITCTINWFLPFFHRLVPKIQCFKKSKCHEGITSRPMKGLFTGHVSDQHSFDPPECAPRAEYSRTSNYMNLDRTPFSHSMSILTCSITIINWILHQGLPVCSCICTTFLTSKIPRNPTH